jgi:hypothetical protein
MPAFEQVRSTRVAAPPATVRAFVADLHAWTKWSPWEGLDDDLQRTYGGADEGVGARYSWAVLTLALSAANPPRLAPPS